MLSKVIGHASVFVSFVVATIVRSSYRQEVVKTPRQLAITCMMHMACLAGFCHIQMCRTVGISQVIGPAKPAADDGQIMLPTAEQCVSLDFRLTGSHAQLVPLLLLSPVTAGPGVPNPKP